MRKFIGSLLLLAGFSLSAYAQNKASDSASYQLLDSVTITAFSKQPVRNIPYNIQRVNLSQMQQQTPRLQMMNQLQQMPSVSAINSGNGINKPVIRGLSFNHVQLFAQGTRIDNQTWDDRHDIGIAENGFDKAEIINGPAALIFGPNTMGGALLFSETPPAIGEKTNGFFQLGAFSNTVGGNFNAGVRGTKNDMYYSLHGSYQMHANYKQGELKPAEVDSGGEKEPLAFNSKFTNIAFKGTIGIRKANSRHQFSYNLYKQSLGIIEDEQADAANNPTKKEDRGYEMEAPYQDVQTHVISTENSFSIGRNQELLINAGYQLNKRKEFEPGDTAIPKSKELGVGLNLQTITGDVQLLVGKSKNAGIAIGVQGFYQSNKNNGNLVLVPDAHITTVGGFAVGHYNTGAWNFLAGVRVDAHQLKMFDTPAPEEDTTPNPFTEPKQELTRNYTPFSFSGGVVYHASKEVSIKANTASGYTAPNYAQLTAFGKHEGTYRFEIGDNTLDMEHNVEGDLTLQYENENVSASLNGYLNHIRNYIFITPTADSLDDLRVYRWTQHDADINGVELNLQLHPANSWFEGFVRGGLLSGKLTNNAGDLPYIPANKIITGVTWKGRHSTKWLHPYVTVQVGAYNSQKHVATFEEATPGYAITDIYAGANPPIGKQHRWKFVLFCDNIFSVAYFNHLSLVKTIDVREPGRNIGLQVRYSF